MSYTEYRKYVDIILDGLTTQDLEHIEAISEAGFTEPFHWKDVEHEHLEDEDE